MPKNPRHYRYVRADDPATVRRPDPVRAPVRRISPASQRTHNARAFRDEDSRVSVTVHGRVPFDSPHHVGRRPWGDLNG